MSLEELMRQRREKLEQWRALGVEPYAYRYPVSHRAADVHSLGDRVTEEDGVRVRVAGRLMSLRGHGRAGFAHLLDGSGKIQLYFRADRLDGAFQRYGLLDVGDWIGVEGPVFRTRTGEITIRVEGFELLAKSLRPLPEKWHGLRDPETRFRQRYADLFMNLEVREIFRGRARLVAALRAGLDERGYLEVETPVLQPLYGGAFARPFVTRHHALDMDLYLRISNELYLKRLLVGGFERVYEFSRDFRNEGMDRSHNPEFTMLEYYQAFADLGDMMELTEALVSRAVEAARGGPGTAVPEGSIRWDPPWERLSMLDALSQRLDVDVRRLDAAALAAVAVKHGVAVRPGSGAGGIIDAMFGEFIQPGIQRPTFVVDFPAEISPLARASRRDPGLVERFEVVAGGIEIANAFSEQNDADAQRRAFEDQAIRAARGDEEAQRTDHDYLRALEYGMPPAGGVGIGIDRLCMLSMNARSIRDVILFPQLRPEEGRSEAEEEVPAADHAAGASERSRKPPR